MTSPMAHGLQPPSPWIVRFTPLALAGDGSREGAGPVTLLDVGCGHGRHLAWFARQGVRVTGVDRSPEAIEAVRPLGEAVLADIENGPWPFGERRFDILLATDYLWRPLLPRLAASLAEGGVLLYETFAAGNETVGRPSRPDFLLAPGELLAWAMQAGLRIVAYEDGFEDGSGPAATAPRVRFVQRIAAIRQAAPGPVRLAL